MRREIERAAIALYDRFTHEGLDRRAFMAELTSIAGGAAAATLLLSSIAARAGAPQVAPEDPRLTLRTVEWKRAPAAAIRATMPRLAPATTCRSSSSSTKIAASTIMSAMSPAASDWPAIRRPRRISSALPAAPRPTKTARAS